ncbi:MAG: tyrosine-type recombinase/integrase [Sedimenticolaceae bacterium]
MASRACPVREKAAGWAVRIMLENWKKTVDGEYVFPGRFGGHKSIKNNRALEAAFDRAGLDDVSSHNLRKTFATRLL